MLGLVLVLIVYGSLYPFTFTAAHTAMLAWVWDPGLPGIRDAIVNLAVYFPAGFLLFRSLRSGSRILSATLVALAISAAMECLQSFDQGRVSSLLDLLLNTAGAAAGACTALLWPARMPASLAVILLAIIARTFPFFPRFDPHLAAFHVDQAHVYQAIFAVVDWLAVRCALAVFLKRSTVTRELAMLQLSILLRIFIIDQSSSIAEIAGGAMALAIGYLWGTAISLRRLAPIFLLTIIGRELLPLHFSSSAQAFHWIPFETILSGAPAGAVIFLNKLLLYGSALWLFDPEGRHMWKYGSALAALLLVLELAQRYLPGRTPDITDSVMVVIAACALSSLRTELRTVPRPPVTS